MHVFVQKKSNWHKVLMVSRSSEDQGMRGVKNFARKSERESEPKSERREREGWSERQANRDEERRRERG